MKNNFLNYLKSNDPEKVVSKSGVRIRKFIFPALRLILKITNPYKQIVVRKAEMPKKKPIIYAPTHSFKDDALNAIVLINKPLYILFGAIYYFYNSLDGIIAWMIGSVVVDRSDKSSRSASLPKMRRAMEFGANALFFPEGSWNLTDELLVMKLYNGAYRLAKLTGALVAPIALHVEGKNCYAILDEPFDIAEYECEKGMEILRDKMATLKFELMEKHSSFTRAELESGGKTIREAWEETKLKIISEVDSATRYHEQHSTFRYKDRNITEYEEAFAHLQEIEITKENAFLLRLCKKRNIDK